MTRLINWQTNLSALIEAKRAEPFDFTKHNCLMWAFDAVKAVTGEDFSLDYRGKYKNEKIAALMLRKIDDVKTPKELLIKKLGKTKPIGFSKIGDIVLVNPNKAGLELAGNIRLFGEVPGVCYGQTSFFVGEFGLIQIETLRLGSTICLS